MFGAIAWGALGGTQLDHESTKSVPMQRGARSVFCRSVPMQRGARFLIFGDRSMVQHGVDEGVKNIYKTNAILHILKTNRKRMARQKRRQKTKIFKNRWKKQYFEHSLWALFGAHLGCSIFWCAQLGCFNGPPINVKNNLK